MVISFFGFYCLIWPCSLPATLNYQFLAVLETCYHCASWSGYALEQTCGCLCAVRDPFLVRSWFLTKPQLCSCHTHSEQTLNSSQCYFPRCIGKRWKTAQLQNVSQAAFLIRGWQYKVLGSKLWKHAETILTHADSFLARQNCILPILNQRCCL